MWRPKTDADLKRYYSIKETADTLNLSHSNIRFWIKEFGLDIKKSGKGYGTRLFFLWEDIEDLKEIKGLLKVKGYKMEAAKSIFEERHLDYAQVGVPMAMY